MRFESKGAQNLLSLEFCFSAGPLTLHFKNDLWSLGRCSSLRFISLKMEKN
jgi:hypothetical protein